jgi:ABC-type nitrate/sulfonate/bicarbonate transport system substrate-binding protein
MLRIGLALLALFGFAIPQAHAQNATPLKPLRFGWQSSTPVITFWAGFELKSFEAQGLKVNLTSFNDNAPELEALVARQLDLAAIAPAPTLQGASFGAPVKIISAVEYAFTDKSGNSWNAVNLLARKDTGIQSLRDLVGKRVAVFGFSSNWYLALLDRLREEKIDPKSIKFLPMPYTQMEGALVHNEVDAAIMTAIGAYHVAQRIPTNLLMNSGQITKIDIDMSQVIVGRADWLKDHEDEAVRFLMGMLVTQKFIADDVAKGGAEIRAITQKTLKYDNETTEAFYKIRLAASGHEQDLLNTLDLPKATFVTYGKMLTESGQLRGKPATTYERLIDTSYLRKAYARLGRKWDESKVVDR